MASQPVAQEAEIVELGVLSELAGYRLRRASAAVGADFTRVLAGTGMRQVLFGILSVVDANPGINQGAVGRVLGVQRANMVALINELVGLGWIDRSGAKEDRRAFALLLTEAGRAMLAHCLALIRVHEEHMLSDLDAADRAQLLALLLRIEAKEP